MRGRTSALVAACGKSLAVARQRLLGLGPLQAHALPGAIEWRAPGTRGLAAAAWLTAFAIAFALSFSGSGRVPAAPASSPAGDAGAAAAAPHLSAVAALPRLRRPPAPTPAAPADSAL
jgi:hypothetical protein